MELKAWTVHFFERRREWVATYCVLKRYKDDRLIWHPIDINYFDSDSMDRDLKIVIEFIKTYDNETPIIYMGDMCQAFQYLRTQCEAGTLPGEVNEQSTKS